MNGVSASSLSSQTAFGGWSAYQPPAHAHTPHGDEDTLAKTDEIGAKSRRVSRPSDTARPSEEDQARIEALKARDREVRAHERAHQAAGGQHAGAASYTFERGPDGRSYAVGGEVPIDASEVRGDPEATIEKMEQVKAAALAPAEPSGQDRKVAAMADAKAAQARAELNRADEEDDTGASGDRLQPSLSQQIAELRDRESSTGLTAYATNAYHHPALAGVVSHGGV